MQYLVTNVFLLILGLLLQLALNIIDQGLRIHKVHLDKNFELELRDRGGALVAMLELGLMETNCAIEQ